jgi:CRISPR-associated protein Cmr2
MTDWKRKLAAYLHDPPEKCYDFGLAHQQRAQTHAESFGVAELWTTLAHNPDWSAAAADRFVFPHGEKLGRNIGEETRPCFVHPMTGRSDNGRVAFPSDALPYPSQAEAIEWLSDIRPDWKSDDPATLFLRAWRNWSAHAAAHASGQGKGAELLPYLPADTRVADGSIWHHCAVVSALEATRAGDNPKDPLRPAFLLFQVGPVQDFIAQARSTRDLWSGSYLLSWLTLHAIKAVADKCGPDAIIFPSLKGQPLYDFLERRLDKQPHDNDVLVPGIPNRFLALVPASFNASEAEEAFKKEWEMIAAACLDWLKQHGLPFDGAHEARFHAQVKRHWHIAWQLWPWQSVNDALTAFKALPLGRENPLHLAKLVAEHIPDAHKDERCYCGGQLDRGWAWSAHYQLCQHALDARRSVRDFQGLLTEPTRKPAHRDALSGREEAVVESAVLENLNSDELRHLFRHAEPLGAANLIKRVWHKAYLARLNEVAREQHLRVLKRARESFDSVPAVAARPFAEWLLSQTASGPLRGPFLAFMQAASAARNDFPDAIARWENDEERWFRFTDASVFHLGAWDRAIQDTPDEQARQRLSKARDALAQLLKASPAQPGKYYAVLALDGDQMGKWLSGEKSPAIQDIISPKAAAYFRDHVQGVDVNKWLASPRPISPSWHLQFSEALANFGLYCARRIVEDVHHGQLIYSGGDDVLAMLPAAEAIACARDLRAAFQGRRADMTPGCQELFRAEAPDGFLWLARPKKEEPSWPLLVPGPRATVSVGIAIGHIKEPLQDMIREAQFAEKRAKADPEREIYDRSDPDPAKHGLRWKSQEGWGRDALAVTLFKRSGETVQWGAKFNSAAFPLLELFQKHYRPPLENPRLEMPISSKFPYRVAELLGKFGQQSPVTTELAAIAEAEFAWITQQQIRPIGPIQSEQQLDELRDHLRQKAAAYLHELRDFAWDRPTPNGEKERTQAARPLCEFINLFALEAFIARTGD